jgi:hypothetical protein
MQLTLDLRQVISTRGIRVITTFLIAAIAAVLISLYASTNATATHEKGAVLQFRCDNLFTKSIDPALDPPPEHTHLHTFWGNRSVAADSTHESLENSTAGTTCHFPDKPTGAQWRAANATYWAPKIRDLTSSGQYQEVSERFLTVYYEDLSEEGGLTLYPEDYTLIANDNVGDVDFRCGAGAVKETPPIGCTASEFRIRVLFQNCFSGGDPTVQANWSRKHDCPAGYTEHSVLRMSIHYWKPPDGRVDGLQVSTGSGTWGDWTTMHADIMEAYLNKGQQDVTTQTAFNTFLKDCAMIGADERRPDKCTP